MRPLTRSPWLWLAAFAVWFGTLWWLSSRVNHLPPELSFRASDKLLHFGYFFGGAGLCSAFLFRLDPAKPRWGRIFALAVIALQHWIIRDRGRDACFRAFRLSHWAGAALWIGMLVALGDRAAT